MGFRFWRRIGLAPGVTLNLSKSGGSLSFGPRGAKLTVGPRGIRRTVGLPGTGLYYTTTGGGKRKRVSRGNAPSRAPAVAPADRLTLGFFRRLVTPAGEEALIDGCREQALGREEAAFAHFRRAAHLPDGAFLAGVLALKLNRNREAVEYLSRAAKRHRELGQRLGKYGIAPALSLPIVEEISVHVGASRAGALMALAEAHQENGDLASALRAIEELRRVEPNDPGVLLSLAELLWESGSRDPAVRRRLVRLTRNVENESALHAALLLYKARALRALGLHTAARDACTQALRRKKDRPDELLRIIRYERALIYEALGRNKRARSELEKIFAEAPDFEDVAQRLGLKSK